VPRDAFDEAVFEVYSTMRSLGEDTIMDMRNSELLRIIGLCSDTAVMLPKKRFVDLDDMKVILFDLKRNGAYITNTDVVIRLSGFEPDTLDGLMDTAPAFDYLSDHFIANPLPYEIEELDKVFDDSYKFSVVIKGEKILKKAQQYYGSAAERRNLFAVLDVGYSRLPGSLVVPRFQRGDNGKCWYEIPRINKIGFIGRHSHLDDEFIDPNKSYVALPITVEEKTIALDVYKEYENTTIVGLYDASIPVDPDGLDISPLDLAQFSEADLIKFKLISAGDNFRTHEEEMRAYRDFTPSIVEAEYLYEVLLLFYNLGFEDVIIYVRAPNAPILIEGVKNDHSHLTVEAVIAPTILGDAGYRCEELLRRPLSAR
jgi:hypothetical protein